MDGHAPQWVDNIWNSAQNTVNSASDWVYNKTNDVVDWTKDNYNQVVSSVNEALNSTITQLAGSATAALEHVKTKVGAFVNEKGFVQFSPKESMATFSKYSKVAKLGTFAAVASNLTEVVATWTDENNLSFEQKLQKNGVQLSVAVVGFAAGSANVTVMVACGATVPETGGLSTAGIIGVVTLDKLESTGLDYVKGQVLKKLGLEE